MKGPRKRRVAELMNPDVTCVGPHTTVAEAAKLLADRGVTGAPVVDDAGGLLGVISQTDLVRHQARQMTSGEAGRFFTDMDEFRDLASVPADLSDTPVSQVMRKQVFTVHRDASAAVAANIMRERKVHRLLVTERGRLVGVVGALDLLRVVEESC
jgi:CBS domain-containing protein